MTDLTTLCRRARAFIESSPPRDSAAFEKLAVDIFAFQFTANAPYRAYCESLGKTPASMNKIGDIPALITTAFKEFQVTAIPAAERTAVFHSSGTTTHRPGRHFHNSETLKLYESSLMQWFKPFVLPDIAQAAFLFLSPPPGRAPRSSLVHMFHTAASNFGSSSRFLADAAADGSWGIRFDEAVDALESAAPDLPLVLCGTAFSFVHLCDFLDARGQSFQLPGGARIFETGGYKGRSRSVSKAELHAMIRERFGVSDAHIISEYGMSELSSQAYDRVAGIPGQRVFQFPPWVRARVISPESGAEVSEGETGLVRVYDLANAGSVMAVQTEDLAIRRGDGFVLLGRAMHAEPRGCSLMPVAT